VLFQLIGTIYGGDGQTTFALPDLRGRDIVGAGGSYIVGEHLGPSTVSLANNQAPDGRGSFVQPRVECPPAVTNLILGYQAQIKVVRMETTAAPGHIAGALGVERGTPLTRLVRLEIVDGAPLAVAVNYMSTALGRRIRPRDLTRMSLLEFLRDRLRMPLGAIHQSIEARLPDLETAGLLDTDLTQPVLAVRLVVTDAAGRAVEVSDTFYRADRYRYEVETRLPPPGRRPDARDARPRRARTVRQP